MPASRENKSLWFYLFGTWPNGSWRGRHLFTRRFWRYGKPLIWHDTIGKYLWKPYCFLMGHGKVMNISDPGDSVQFHCFRCETTGVRYR